jgi:hypothetical protein
MDFELPLLRNECLCGNRESPRCREQLRRLGQHNAKELWMVRCCNRLAEHAAAAATVVVVVVVVHILKEAVLRKSRVHRNMDSQRNSYPNLPIFIGRRKRFWGVSHSLIFQFSSGFHDASREFVVRLRHSLQ